VLQSGELRVGLPVRVLDQLPLDAVR
jgi:hypothetical protein